MVGQYFRVKSFQPHGIMIISSVSTIETRTVLHTIKVVFPQCHELVHCRHSYTFLYSVYFLNFFVLNKKTTVYMYINSNPMHVGKSFNFLEYQKVR